ncbi:MAG: YidB family protein [Ilumatobacteraceae bacterium]
MGLLDIVTGMLGKKSKQQRGGVPGLPDLGPLTSMLGGGGQAGLIKVLLPALLGGGALAKLGGLGGILGKLQGGGLGNQANSWVGTGQNEEVHPTSWNPPSAPTPSMNSLAKPVCRATRPRVAWPRCCRSWSIRRPRAARSPARTSSDRSWASWTSSA